MNGLGQVNIPLYNSRRNRHCPKCQVITKERTRHYGFPANRFKKERIGAIRLLLGLTKELPEVVEKSVQEQA